MKEKTANRLMGMLLAVLAVVVAFVARPAPAQDQLQAHAHAGYATTLDSIHTGRAVTRDGRTLYFDAGTRVLIGNREMSGDNALEALAPGMNVYVAAGKPLANGALAVERIEIVLQ